MSESDDTPAIGSEERWALGELIGKVSDQLNQASNNGASFEAVAEIKARLSALQERYYPTPESLGSNRSPKP